MKILSSVLLVSTLLFSMVVAAETETALAPGSRASLEIDPLNILLSKDGTGIIKDAGCGHCNFKFVKITANSKAFANGVRVDISRASSRAGKQAYIEFDAKTAELLSISWSE